MVQAVEEDEPWVGIDLGTTNTVVALWRGNTTEKYEILNDPEN